MMGLVYGMANEWLGWEDTNILMRAPKARVLPHGDSPGSMKMFPILRSKQPIVYYLFITKGNQRTFNHLFLKIDFTSSGNQVNSRHALTPDDGCSSASRDITLA